MDFSKLREDFPVLRKEHKGKRVVYLDSACMSLKPVQVSEAVMTYYRDFPACAGRSGHSLGKKVTEEVEKTRKELSRFFSTNKQEQVVFTRNTTEAINLVARSMNLERGDSVVISDKEHNSNLVPWLYMKKVRGIEVIVVKSNEDNTFNLGNFQKSITKSTKLVSLVHTSNLDGTTTPAREVIKIAHDNHVPVLLDGAQSAPHKEIDLKKLDADYFACSGHKMLGPTGTGMLYSRDEFEGLEPFMLGGDTVENTTYTDFSLLRPPERYEAGLQDYSGIVGWRAAVEFLGRVGIKEIESHELELNKRITEALSGVPGLHIIGPRDPALRPGIFNFYVDKVNYHDLALLLDNNAGIMIRSGQHCVHSWFNSRGVKGSDRVSFYLYNNKEDVDRFVEEVNKALRILR